MSIPFRPAGQMIHVETFNPPEPSEPRIRRVTIAEPGGKPYRVVACGPGAYKQDGERLPVSFKPGDVVMADPKKVILMMYGNHAVMVVAEVNVLGSVDQG